MYVMPVLNVQYQAIPSAIPSFTVPPDPNENNTGTTQTSNIYPGPKNRDKGARKL